MPAKKAKKPAKPTAKKAVKKPVVKKAAPKKTASKKVSSKKTVKPKAEVIAGQFLGEVEDYFTHVNVATVTLKDALSNGDTIRIKGHTTDLIQKVESMQINHVPISSASKGDPVGIKVNDRCRAGDKIYKI